MAVVQTGELKYGLSTTIKFLYKDAAQQLVDLSVGYTASMKLREQQGDTVADVVLDTLTYGNGRINLLDGAAGHNGELIWSTADAKILDNRDFELVGDLELITGGETVFSGRAKFNHSNSTT